MLWCLCQGVAKVEGQLGVLQEDHYQLVCCLLFGDTPAAVICGPDTMGEKETRLSVILQICWSLLLQGCCLLYDLVLGSSDWVNFVTTYFCKIWLAAPFYWPSLADLDSLVAMAYLLYFALVQETWNHTINRAAFVCLSVCLSVCLFPISSEVLWPIFAKLGGCM